MKVKRNKLHQLKLKNKAMYSRAFEIISYDADCVSLAGMPIGQPLLNIEGWHIVMSSGQTWFVSNEVTPQPLYDIQMEYQVNGSNDIEQSTSFSFIGTIPHRPK